MKNVKLLCEAGIAGSCAGLVWCRMCHNIPFNVVFTSVFRLANGFRQFGGVTFVAVFKALIMVVEAGFKATFS